MYLVLGEMLMDQGVALDNDVWDYADEQFFGGILQ